MIIQDLLSSDQTILPKEDRISAFMYVAALPKDVLSENVESASKLMFHLMTQHFQFDFCNQFANILIILDKNSYFHFNTDSCIRFYVQDKFTFQVVLFTSLKYRKKLFTQCDTNNDIVFLQNCLQHMLDIVCLDKFESLHLLKLIEMLLKKRQDILLPELSWSILKHMNKVSFSPLPGFKHCAHNISRIVLKSLPYDTRKILCNIYHFPVKGIDLNDILKLCEEKQFRSLIHVVIKCIQKLFSNNTDSRNGSFYYETLISFYNFEEFIQYIWPFYGPHLEQIDEGEFYQSFLKYWIPITVSRYCDDFYVFLKNKNVDHFLKACTLLELKKKGHYNKEKFDLDTWRFLKFSTTCNVGLKIVCSYMKKNIYPDKFEIQAVQFYLENYSHFELPPDVLKSFKQFISQVFFVSHITLSKNLNADLDLYIKFLNYLYKFCSSRLDVGKCEVPGQLLKIIWDVACGSSQDLTTIYKIDRENMYEIENNLYYLKLKSTGIWGKTVASTFFINKLEKFFDKESSIFCPNLIILIKERYLCFVDLHNFQSLDSLFKDINQSVCLQTSEKMRIYTDLLLSHKKINRQNYEGDISKLFDIFYSKIDSLNSQDLFCCVLILDIFITVVNYEQIDLIQLLEKCLQIFEKIFEENPHEGFDVKATKVLESLINNVIECFMSIKSQWPKFQKSTILDQLCKIIQKSNMKRPLSLTVNAVQYFGASLEENDDDRELKLKFLSRTLNSLYFNKQRGKIRRNPETRLVIHALCLSDKNQTKPYLVWSINFMLDVLSNPSSSDYTISATLHSLEVLVSDNSIHQYTFPFLAEIIKHCVKLFNRTNWIIRNADLQLLKSLIERLLGVQLDYDVRPKTIEDIFILFPTIVDYFYEILSQPCLNDSAIVVMTFFSESQIKNNIFIDRSLKKSIEDFRFLFANIVKTYPNNFGFLALKSLSSLCVDDAIPQLFSETVYYIQQNFTNMQKNVFVNFITLLQKLYQKHKKSLDSVNNQLIRNALFSLLTFLKPFNNFYFYLLSLKLSTVEEALDEITLKLDDDNFNYKKRIWFDTYLPYLIINSNLNQLKHLLNQMLLLHEVSEFLQIKILSVLVDRFSNQNQPITDVVQILILKITKLKNCSNFLIMSYTKTVLLFYEIMQNLDICDSTVNEVRQDFYTECIHKIVIYVLVLAHADNKTVDDNVFLNKCIEKYKENINGDDEVLTDLAVTMVHLHKLSFPHNRFDILKLTFLLLLNKVTAFEMCKFVSFLTKSQCSSVILSFVSLLSFKHLSKYLSDQQLIFKLLTEFYTYIDSLPDEFEASDTYYLIENDFTIPMHYVRRIVLKSLESFCKHTINLR